MRTLNLGILAHVDAGKTSLTERLLYAAGVIDKIGRVDDGNTQTDTLDLERQRGITIKSAVVSFEIDDLTINLIDTPGHPDFIAEVERVLGVLDGAVLVISAVEGVQPQTRILMRALQRLGKPTLIFVNKIDRVGANPDRVVAEIAARLSPAVVALGTVDRPGSAAASFVPFEAADEAFRSRLTDLIASVDDAFIAAYLRDERAGSYPRLRRSLTEQTKQARVHPILFGSAMTGAGIADVIAGIAEYLPAIDAPFAEPLAGTVFKIERGPAGEKIAYARLFSGAIRVRDRVPYGEGHAEKITAIDVFDRGAATPGQTLVAGRIGKLWGLGAVQIGDRLGHRRSNGLPHHFAPPTLETVVVPRWPGDLGPLHAALSQLAEQDPLINVRQDDLRQEIAISLYGEVQKEVIQATLAADFGLEATFRESTTICIERPTGIGGAVEYLRQPPNPFLATVGLHIEPGPIGSGVRFQLAIDVHGTMPAAFFAAVEETVRATMRQGLHGWEVTDCLVTMTHSGYAPRQSHAHQRFSKSMSSTGADFRGLTPLVVMAALRRAGTAVCEPVHRFTLEVPADAFKRLLPVLSQLRAVPRLHELHGSSHRIDGEIPAAAVHQLQQRLPVLTGGEGVLETAFDHYDPMRGPVPSRPRWDHNPLNRKEYLLHVERRV